MDQNRWGGDAGYSMGLSRIDLSRDMGKDCTRPLKERVPPWLFIFYVVTIPDAIICTVPSFILPGDQQEKRKPVGDREPWPTNLLQIPTSFIDHSKLDQNKSRELQVSPLFLNLEKSSSTDPLDLRSHASDKADLRLLKQSPSKSTKLRICTLALGSPAMLPRTSRLFY